MSVLLNNKSNGNIRIRPKSKIIIQPNNQGSFRSSNSKILIKQKKLIIAKALGKINLKIIFSKKLYQWEIWAKI